MQWYEYFDDIVLLNLRERTERKQSALTQLARVMPLSRLRIFTAELHPQGGMTGCFDSHIKIIAAAYAAGTSHLLIFEDDVMPNAMFDDAIMQRCAEQFTRGGVADLMYFGYLPCTVREGFSFFVAKQATRDLVFFKPCSTHAYCMNRRAMHAILQSHHDFIGKEHIDRFYNGHLPSLRSVVVVPSQFDQEMCMGTDVGLGTGALYDRITWQNIVMKTARDNQCALQHAPMYWSLARHHAPVLILVAAAALVLLFLAFLNK